MPRSPQKRSNRPEPAADLTAAVGNAQVIVMFGVRFERSFFERIAADVGQPGGQHPEDIIAVDLDADGGRRIVVRNRGVTRPGRSPRGTSGSEFFTAEEWFRFPLPLRERWWAETDYSKKAPSADLLAAINQERGRK